MSSGRETIKREGDTPVHPFVPERDMAQSDGEKRCEDQNQLDESRFGEHDEDRCLRSRSRSTSETSPRYRRRKEDGIQGTLCGIEFLLYMPPAACRTVPVGARFSITPKLGHSNSPVVLSYQH